MDFTISTQGSVTPVIKQIDQLVRKGLSRGNVIITLGRESKSREQEKKYHALIGDIAKTVNIGVTYSVEAWKALLVDEFEQELKRGGEKLSKPGKVTISLDQERAVTIRPSTTNFKKHEGSKFIEFLYFWGSQHGAVFSEKTIEYVNENRAAE